MCVCTCRWWADCATACRSAERSSFPISRPLLPVCPEWESWWSGCGNRYHWNPATDSWLHQRLCVLECHFNLPNTYSVVPILYCKEVMGPGVCSLPFLVFVLSVFSMVQFCLWAGNSVATVPEKLYQKLHYSAPHWLVFKACESF